MRVLIISDDPDRWSFRQVLTLKKNIENMDEKQVDLITFSSDGIFVNRKLKGKKMDVSTILSIFKNLLKSGTYDVFIMSLKRKYLKRLFRHDWNVLDLINRTSPQATVFIFGASSILNDIKTGQWTQPISLHFRNGVAKLTHELRNAIIEQILKRPKDREGN